MISGYRVALDIDAAYGYHLWIVAMCSASSFGLRYRMIALDSGYQYWLQKATLDNDNCITDTWIVATARGFA